MPIYSAQKETLFNCSYDELFIKTEKLVPFFKLNGYNVDVSKTTSCLAFKKHLKIFHLAGVDISFELYLVRDLDDRTKLISSTSFNYTSTVHYKVVSLNLELAQEFNDKIVMSLRNIIENKSTIEFDLLDLKLQEISSNDKRNVNIIFYASIIFLFLIIYFFVYNLSN